MTRKSKDMTTFLSNRHALQLGETTVDLGSTISLSGRNARIANTVEPKSGTLRRIHPVTLAFPGLSGLPIVEKVTRILHGDPADSSHEALFEVVTNQVLHRGPRQAAAIQAPPVATQHGNHT